MEIRGQSLKQDHIQRIAAIVDKSEPGITRKSLSLQICKEFGWQSANGDFQEVSCRKLLCRLDREGHISLPSIRINPFQYKSPKLLSVIETPNLECKLEELGKIEIVPVGKCRSKTSRIWNSLMEEHHYLGSGPLCGQQIRYLIRIESGEYIGGFGFNSAVWRLKERDKWIGWSEKARRLHISKVITNSRFLIVPTVKVPHLASHVLSLVMKRLANNWEERYGQKPILIETFVDGAKFDGTSYKAANWIHLGQTAGRKDGFSNGKFSSGKKEIYIYPLSNNAKCKRLLCTEPKPCLRIKSEPVDNPDWTKNEFSGIEIFDERVTDRLSVIATDLFARPGKMIPEVCGGSMPKIKAFYRFLDNRNIDMEVILKPHIESTIGRIQEHKVVLVPQDTTILDYTMHQETEGLGPVNRKESHHIGLILHDTLAFSIDGTPLGLLDAQCWARDPNDIGKKERRSKLPTEEKESYKWFKSFRAVGEAQKLCPNTMLVSIADREAGIYELFHEAVQDENNPKLLVRADKSKKRRVEQESLWESMSKEKILGYKEITIPRRSSRKARTTRLELHCRKITLTPPLAKNLPSVEVFAVYAREVDYTPDIKDPVEWMLLTTVETATFEEAVERLDWYSKRWGIEVYHRTLKSGCHVEDRQMDRVGRLRNCIALDMVVAWRIYMLTMLGRERPDLPCDMVLSYDEWQALMAFHTNKPPPKEPPTIREAMFLIAKMGGFPGRKADGNPGTTTLWRGLKHLVDLTLGYKAAMATVRMRDGP